MALLTYVSTYDDIRALLGVSSDELEDSTLALRVFSMSLDEGFNEIDESMGNAVGTLAAQFAIVAAIAENSRTATQARFFNTMQSYASYHVAFDLTDTLPQFSPKTITDGKAAVARHAESSFQITLDGVRLGKARALARLKRAATVQLGGTVEAVTTPVISPLYISSPTSDPVNGT